MTSPGHDRSRARAPGDARPPGDATDRLASLVAIEQILDASADVGKPESLLQALLEKLRELLSADTAAILLPDRTGTRLIPRAASGLEPVPGDPPSVPLGKGLAGRVAASRSPLTVLDLDRFDVVRQTLRRNARSLAAAPLMIGDRVLGVVHVGTRRQREFANEELLLLRIAAERAAAAIDRALGAERVRRSEQTALVGRAALAFSESLDLETTLTKILDIVIPTIGDFGFLDVVTEDRSLRRRVSAPEDPERLALLERLTPARLDTDPHGVSDEAGLYKDLDETWPRHLTATPEQRDILRALRWCSLIVVPLVVNKRVLGALNLFRAAGSIPFSRKDVRLVQEVSAAAAMALENAHLYREAQQAARRKDEFLAMLGHELRNPLAPIVTALELLRHQRSPALGREFDVIERQISHLLHLVDDLLDVSRITQGKLELHPKPVEVANLVTEAVEQASPLLERHRHRFVQKVPDKGLRVRADPHRMAQVLSNLLTNAAKYTPEGGTIVLEARQDGGRVLISVEDDGIGIPADLFPRLFDPFSQGTQSIDRARGGLGLGLAIVKSLVELHDGTIEVASPGPDRGSRFTICLPRLVTGLEIPAVDTQRPAMPVAPLRILVVDDNRDAAQTLHDLLEQQGHAVKIATDGPSALRVASEFTPDAALLDIGLPVMDGYELGARLRQILDPPPRLIAITGYGLVTDQRRSEEAGFEAHLVKPVSTDALWAAIERLPAPPPP